MQKLGLQQRLLQKLSPQQIQLMKLLQLPTIELEQRIKSEIEENPALEEGVEKSESAEDEFRDELEGADDFNLDDYISDDEMPSYKTNSYNTSPDTEEKGIPVIAGSSFQEILEQQVSLRILDDTEKVIARQIIGNLDDDGYLRRELEAIVDDLAFSQNIMVDEDDVLNVLYIVQDMEPAGVGARDLQECLLLQLAKKGGHGFHYKTAYTILEKYFDDFIKKHFSKIQKRMDLLDEDLKLSIEEITKLNPKPGNSIRETNKSIMQVIPDFILTENDGNIELNLNNRNAPMLKVNRTYSEMVETFQAGPKDKKSKDAIMFVKQKLDSAKWFIDAIKQRQNTLLITMNAIVKYQKDYFLTGDDTQLKPMILKDIADLVGLDISTVSRVANSKYVQTPYGTFLLKSFFTESMSTDSGEEVSTREIKSILKQSIDNEDKKKPLTDEKLGKVLNEKGYNIARRTVAKYREQLGIPVARLRKEL